MLVFFDRGKDYLEVVGCSDIVVLRKNNRDGGNVVF
jgi:hypothetical protein